MLKNIRGSRYLLLLLALILLSACSKKPEYHWERYSESEMRSLFEENEELFNQLVEVLVSETDFFDKGRRDEYEDATLDSLYDDSMELFSESGRQTVREFFELKPYMIAYDDDQRFIKITFIAQEEWECGGFLCWLKPHVPESIGIESELEEFIFSYEQNHYVEHITGNWYFFKWK